jgi:hypothetical protein
MLSDDSGNPRVNSGALEVVGADGALIYFLFRLLGKLQSLAR